MLLTVTLNATPSMDLQIVVYLRLMGVGGCESGGRLFLWVVSNIKLSVTASYVLEKYRTSVFMSVFCDAWGSMELTCDKQCPRDNAVSLYFLEIPHFNHLEELKMFKNNVRNIYFASELLCILFVLKVRCGQFYTMSFLLVIHLFDFFHIFTISC